MFRKQLLNTIIIKAAVIAALMIVLLLLGSYTCSKNRQLKCVGLFYSYPLSFNKVGSDIKVYNFKDTILIFYYSEYILYRLSPMVKFETDEKIKGTEPYFIYNSKKKFGYFFTSLKDSTIGKRYPVDSFLTVRGMRNKDFDMPADSIWSLVKTTKKGKSDLVEKYALIKQGDETSIDSIYYYYSKDKNTIEYSLSKKLDSLSGMKLFKVRMLFNEKFSPSNGITLPQREVIFEIQKHAVSDPQEIIDFITKVNATHLNL